MPSSFSSSRKPAIIGMLTTRNTVVSSVISCAHSGWQTKMAATSRPFTMVFMSLLLFERLHLAGIDDSRDRAAARRTLLQRRHRAVHHRITDRRRRHRADDRLGVVRVMNVGIVERHLPASAQAAGRVGLAFDEAIDQRAAQV